MINNALVHALRKFSRKEMTRFKEFSDSPYFNKHKEVRALINYLSDKYPDFSAKNCDRHRIWKKIVQRETYDYAHLSMLFTYSWKLYERFVAFENIIGKDIEERFFLVEYFREQGLYKAYEKSHKGIAKSLRGADFRDASYYFNLFRFAQECDQKYLKVTQKREDDGLQEKQDALDIWYCAMKLRDACEMFMRHRYFGENYAAGMLE